MIRFLKKTVIAGIVLFLLGVFFYLVVLPKVLPRQYATQVEKYTEQYDVEPALVYAVIYCESKFSPEALSHAGAMGLMQVTPETGWWVASQIGELDPDAIDLYDPDTNITVGCWYLNWLGERFSEQETALAAYNAGHGNVAKWLDDADISTDGVNLDDIPFNETKVYVKKVMIMKKLYEICYGI